MANDLLARVATRLTILSFVITLVVAGTSCGASPPLQDQSASSDISNYDLLLLESRLDRIEATLAEVNTRASEPSSDRPSGDRDRLVSLELSLSELKKELTALRNDLDDLRLDYSRDRTYRPR